MDIHSSASKVIVLAQPENTFIKLVLRWFDVKFLRDAARGVAQEILRVSGEIFVMAD
jgi:hypothetical protein